MLPEQDQPEKSCTNCDGRKCMGCVFREYDHLCADDCPECCDYYPLGESPPLEPLADMIAEWVTQSLRSVLDQLLANAGGSVR